MARTLPVPAGQPLEATRTAAGQVVTLACAEAVAVQAAASLTLAALLWPLIPAARAVAVLASALGQRLPLCPLPEPRVVVVMPGSGGAGRGATVPGGRPGAVRAAGAITLGAAAGPVTGQAAGAAGLRSRLLDHVYPALSDHGGTETVTRLLGRLDQRGTGAGRQRALFASAASAPAFITALARATLSGYQPGRWRRPGARVPAAAGAQ